MSLSVTLTCGGDLNHIANKDLAEHLCRIVNEAIQQAADKAPGSTVTLGDPWERKTSVQARPLNGVQPYGSPSDSWEAVMGSYIHLP